jgi:methylmalonyl-CoA/ethylmalonyl-CoA epimerase
MLKSVHHLNFLVRDLEAAVARWRTLFGFDVALRESLPDRGVITARFRIGETWIVLVQPTETDSAPGRHLREHGEGPFLVSFAVENLELARARTMRRRVEKFAAPNDEVWTGGALRISTRSWAAL